MGSSQSSPFKEQLLGYKQIQKFPDNNMTFLSHVETGQQFLLLQHTYNDEELFKKSFDMHKLRQLIAEDHLTHLSRIQGKEIDHLCSSLYKIYVLWEYPYRSLHEQITERSYQNRKFEDKELWSILASTILALSTLQKNKIKHEMITTKTILLDNDGLIKIADPLSLGSVTNMDVIYRNRNVQGIYLSPQQCQALQSRGEYNNSFKNDVWTIGLILLECGLLKNLSNCYKDEYQRIDYQIIDKYLQQFGNIYGQQLQFITELMLKRDNKDRPDWVDLQQYTRKSHEKDNLNSSPNLPETSKNGSNFTPKSNKQILSAFSPQRLIFNKPLESHLTGQQTVQQNREFIQNIYTPASTSIIYNQPIQYQTLPSINSYVFQPHYMSNINNSIPNNNGNLFNTATFPTPTSISNNYTPKLNSMNPIEPTQPINSNIVYASSNTGFGFKHLHPTQYKHLPLSLTGSPLPTQRPSSTEPTSKYQPWKNSIPQTSLNSNKIGSSLPYSVNQIQLLKNEHLKTDHTKFNYKSNFPTSTQYNQFNQKSSESKYMISNPLISNQNFFNTTSNNINNNYNTNAYLFNNNNQYSTNLLASPSIFQTKTSEGQSNNNQTKSSKQQQLNKIYPNYSVNSANTKKIPPTDNNKSANNYVSQNNWKNYQSLTNKNQLKQLPNKNYTSNNQFNNQNYPAPKLPQKNGYLGGMQTQSVNIQNLYEDSQKLQYVVQTFKQGSRYEGFKLKDMRHGKGKFFYQDGGMYDGNWSKNKMDGFGSLYYQSGKLAYQGMWVEDQFQGRGKLYNQFPHQLNEQFNYKNFDLIDDFWSYYEGDFVQDYKKGIGKLVLSNGQYFEGTFNDDMIQGPGTFCCKNNEVIRGIWNNNHLLQK